MPVPAPSRSITRGVHHHLLPMKEEMEPSSHMSSTPSAGDLPNRRTRRHLQRRVIRAVIGVAAVLVISLAAALWLSAKASTIISEMRASAGLLPSLKESILRADSASAKATVSELKTHTAAARSAASDPVWVAAQSLPWIGSNFRAASEVTTSIDDVAQLGAVPLVDVFQTLDWISLAPRPDGMDLSPLADARPKIQAAAQAVSQSSIRLFAIETSGLLPEVADQLVTARDQLDALKDGLTAAADVAQIAPRMMGHDQPKQFLVLVQNNAEARATGGIPGALAILRLHQGQIVLESQTSAAGLGAFSPQIPLDASQESIYSKRLGIYMQDVNLTPDFPTSAHIAHSMWSERTGVKVDGVISVDPVALQYLLEATGPVKMTESVDPVVAKAGLPTELTAQNVVSTLLSDVYTRIDAPFIQDAYFSAAAKQIFDVVASGEGNPEKLISGLVRGVEESRIHVWSADPQHQTVIARYPLGGSIAGPSVSPAQFGVYFNDGTGAKMDLYMRRTVQLIKECPRDGYEQTTVRVTSTNTAPADAGTSFPPYVTGDGVFGVPAGSVQTNIVAYGPAQALVETAKIDGKRTEFAPYIHSNRPVGVLAIRLAPGETRSVDFTFGKIVQHTEPSVVVTPTVHPVKDVTLPTLSPSCG